MSEKHTVPVDVCSPHHYNSFLPPLLASLQRTSSVNLPLLSSLLGHPLQQYCVLLLLSLIAAFSCGKWETLGLLFVRLPSFFSLNFPKDEERERALSSFFPALPWERASHLGRYPMPGN